MFHGFTESQARLAGHVAATDAICDFVERQAMRDKRAARLERNKRERRNGRH